MIEVANRSIESWGPLARCSDAEFNRIINNRKGDTKDLIKKVKKLKTYRVSFKKHLCSDWFEIRAESADRVSEAARKYFEENESEIGFVATTRSPWASSYPGYDSISHVRVK